MKGNLPKSFFNQRKIRHFLHFPLLYCMIVTNFLIVQFSFFILLLASWQILILVLSTRPAKVASRCRDLNPGSSACLAEMLPLDQESLLKLMIQFCNFDFISNLYHSRKSELPLATAGDTSGRKKHGSSKAVM